MPRRLFADEPVKFSKLPAYRAEHFPYAGPYPWLDRPDASDRIDEKLQRGEINADEAEQCRHWASQGYIILRQSIDGRTLDDVWNAYEKAIQAGKIKLQPEPAGENDPYPGRFLNPHKKNGGFLPDPETTGSVAMDPRSYGTRAKAAADHNGAQRIPARCAFRFDPHDHISAGIFVRCLDRVRRHSSRQWPAGLLPRKSQTALRL